ncbi:hypothetical protein [Acinetobacter sp.]|jgi:hypothetical protein|uniref:hypothetical protein n=1 Tax=Acinetobacter sp. TaxID=472 RepID=UPI002819E917|nr:hypothetical protein [Acinetobacter sp.]MDR0238115.1 hypothetical protein [Acinetobacter sp.]
MDKCREAFEQIPEINKRLFYLNFDEKYKSYHPKPYSLDFGFVSLNFVQGAWLTWQSRQAEVDEANAKSQMCRDEKTHAINRWSQIRKEVEEKDKRIEEALYALKGLKAENDLWGCNQVEVQIDVLEKALRGEHE